MKRSELRVVDRQRSKPEHAACRHHGVDMGIESRTFLHHPFPTDVTTPIDTAKAALSAKAAVSSLLTRILEASVPLSLCGEGAV